MTQTRETSCETIIIIQVRMMRPYSQVLVIVCIWEVIERRKGWLPGLGSELLDGQWSLDWDSGTHLWGRNIELGFRHGKFDTCRISKWSVEWAGGDTILELRSACHLHRGGNGSLGSKLNHLQRACSTCSRTEAWEMLTFRCWIKSKSEKKN